MKVLIPIGLGFVVNLDDKKTQIDSVFFACCSYICYLKGYLYCYSVSLAGFLLYTTENPTSEKMIEITGTLYNNTAYGA